MAYENAQGQRAAISGRKRYASVAVLLALLVSPFVSMLYLGRGWRALSYLVLTVLAGAATLLLASAELWPKGVDWSLVVLALWIVGAVDSYRIARHHRKEFSGPWYSRWYGLSAVLLLLLAVVVGTKAFLIGAFRIRSDDMIPTLLAGDFILVNKVTYGVRLPVLNVKVFSGNEPKRGEMMVFRFPEKPSLIYIKRVIGLPGDEVTYRDKRLVVNGKSVATEAVSGYPYPGGSPNPVTARRFMETLGDQTYAILTDPDAPAIQLAGVRQFPHRENCAYEEDGFSCKVPAGHYFLMGDNRDRSSDSRYWGFVPERNILGKGLRIWWNTEAPVRS